MIPPLLIPPITPFLLTRYTVPPYSLHQLSANKATTATSAAAMGSKPRISAPTGVRRLRRRLSNSKRRLSEPQVCQRRSTHIDGGASVSDKLEALRNLIPSENAEIKPEQLFRETADYIVLLKTQVLVLQKLVDFYGSQPQENRDAV